MLDNDYYMGLMEGRFPFQVEMTEDGDEFVASYTDQAGQVHSVRSTSRADAHNQCTDLVREGVRQGTIVPGR